MVDLYYFINLPFPSFPKRGYSSNRGIRPLPKHVLSQAEGGDQGGFGSGSWRHIG
jgi:hypothetical protein